MRSGHCHGGNSSRIRGCVNSTRIRGAFVSPEMNELNNNFIKMIAYENELSKNIFIVYENV